MSDDIDWDDLEDCVEEVHEHAEYLEDQMVVARCSSRSSGELVVHIPAPRDATQPKCGINHGAEWRPFSREWVITRDSWRVCKFCRRDLPSPDPDFSTFEDARDFDPDDLPPLDDSTTAKQRGER